MELYEVNQAYISYLRSFEPSKILSNAGDKGNRKFIGIIMKKGKYNYVVPLSSPKFNKDYNINGYVGDTLPRDFSFKNYLNRINLLKDTTEPVVYMYSRGTGGIDFFGKIQCNNMIPVPDSELIKIDVNAEPDQDYKALLQKQINYIRKNEDEIIKKHINPVYNNRINNRMSIGYIRAATPDFAYLEEKCDEWIETH
ncbi:MAG: type III toxin-antitoxin system ToxN/AbiQ family toxin [Methanosphaera stadtmanae]|nr:type III toxin-antitoxin system ToxN/AbiQ family toxin [Methanosphaera stadtmanae]